MIFFVNTAYDNKADRMALWLTLHTVGHLFDFWMIWRNY